MNATLRLYPLNSKPFGLSYSDWTAKWWQWFLSIPKSSSPALDTTGINANIGQNNPNVFFLCQTYEGVDSTPHREVVIDSDRALFMPVINWISILNYDGVTEQEIFEKAKERMDVVAKLEMKINEITLSEEDLRKYRVQSPLFDVNLPEGNIMELKPGLVRAVSDGFWIFLEPLNKETSLSSFGSCSSGVTNILVNYHIRPKQ